MKELPDDQERSGQAALTSRYPRPPPRKKTVKCPACLRMFSSISAMLLHQSAVKHK